MTHICFMTTEILRKTEINQKISSKKYPQSESLHNIVQHSRCINDGLQRYSNETKEIHEKVDVYGDG